MTSERPLLDKPIPEEHSSRPERISNLNKGATPLLEKPLSDEHSTRPQQGSNGDTNATPLLEKPISNRHSTRPENLSHGSSLLGAYATSLFSIAIRCSLALRLRKPMSLATFVSALSVSGSKIVARPLKWLPLSGVVLALTCVQTSMWSTFLTPVDIVINTPVTGSELDLKSPVLRNMPLPTLQSCIYDNSQLDGFISGQTAGGYAFARNKTGAPGSFVLMDQTFNISTAGILPGSFADINAGLWFPTLTRIPSTLKHDKAVPNVDQQGFSVDVSCTTPAATANINPALIIQNNSLEWPSGPPLFNFTYTEMSADCPVPDNSNLNVTSTVTRVPFAGDDPNYAMMIACKGDSNYTLRFKSSGVYGNGTGVCKVSPKITRVNVAYPHTQPASGGIISTSVTVDDSVPDLDGPAGISAIATIASMMFLGQGLLINIASRYTTR
ncbi:hypothetical protein C8R43DRAFT_1207070 [Mycena crocata]|nr:hypothetical protein C8R43DRAFT_1207070 [Mycena crocata]